MIHLSIDGHFRLRYPVFAQFGRMTAVQTVKEQDRQLLEADTGDIWTMPFNDDDWRNFPKKRVDYEDMQMINRDLKTFSLITTCAQVFDDEIRGTGVFTVQDSLIRSDIYKSGSGSNIMEYREYEEVSTHGFFRTTQIVEFNLEVFIRFDEWSCCSACCCSEVMCGDMATEDKCDQVFSTKSRKGYLSIRKLNHTLPISTPCPASTSQKLDHMLSMSSYNETGIALFSSILYTLTNGKDCGVVDFREQILVKVLEVQNVNPANFTYSGRGLVLESQTCNDDPQKKDCMLLAKCRGMQLKESYWEKKEEVDGSDPCEGIDFIEILLRDEDIEYKAKKGPNFKVSLDPDFYDENSTSVRYRVAHIFAFPYDLRKSCMEQKGYVVHPNYKDLIILGITRSDMNRKIEVSFADSDKRIKVRFKDESERGGIEGVNRSELVMWCSLIILFFLMLVGLVVFMAYEKSARTKTALKIKKKEQNDFTFKLPIKSVSKLSSEESSNERAILPTSKPVPVPILSPKTPPIPRN
ncbi:hypothetical protein WR25_11560 [Diploscapter pachys]|uniref:Uncharacterized protein n=1 Tax=Diploscapter pachys TaxID=2018661 RepID=A0A2A2JPT0_9BILA|nr:hypothetical protein WR25_11560 [Diploscapter pachys]